MKFKWVIPPIVSIIIISTLFYLYYILNLGGDTGRLFGPFVLSIIIVSLISIYGIFSVLFLSVKGKYKFIRSFLFLTNVIILIGYVLWFFNESRGM